MAIGPFASFGGTKPKPSPLQTAYGSAVDENAQNYDDIMHGYDSLQKKARNDSSSRLNYIPINPVFTKNIQGQSYTRNPELSSAMSGLEEYTKTGGYSDSDISNIRERGISPIRSIYDSANRNINRQKVLSGGYAPNLGAVTSKLNREAAGQIGDITTKINAQIAEMIASGKLNSLNSLGSLASRDNELQNQINARNTEGQNEVERLNAAEEARVNELNNEYKLKVEQLNKNNENQGFNNELNAVQGKQSLYGTTPALTANFAQQVLANNAQNLQAQTTANAIKNQRTNIGMNLLNSQPRSPWERA